MMYTSKQSLTSNSQFETGLQASLQDDIWRSPKNTRLALETGTQGRVVLFSEIQRDRQALDPR